MTPKEKAERLHDKFFNVELAGEEAHPMERVTYLHAKACAIICVQQIIKEMNDCLEITGSSYVKQEVWHWNLVLDFLNKS